MEIRNPDYYFVPKWRRTMETLGIFSQALETFYQKDFIKASGLFKEVLSKNPDDRAAGRFLTRSAGYIVEGVPEDWTGVEMMIVMFPVWHHL